MRLTYEEIQTKEAMVADQRKTLSLAWGRRWCGAGRVKSELSILADITLDLFKAYDNFEPDWKEYLFK